MHDARLPTDLKGVEKVFLIEGVGTVALIHAVGNHAGREQCWRGTGGFFQDAREVARAPLGFGR